MPVKVRPKPTEVKAIVKLLEEEHPDVEELAKQVIIELKERWINDDYYVVVMHDPNAKMLFTYGPYSTKRQAEKELESLSSAGPLPSRGWISKLYEVNDGS